MQYGGMHLLRVSGWVAVIIAARAVLIIGVAAAHPRRRGRLASASRGQQVIAAGLARAIEQYFAPPAP